MSAGIIRWSLAFLVALLNDAFDVFGLGSLPVAGDVLDVATGVILLPLVGGVEPVLGAVELVPGADFLPIFTLVTLFAFYRRKA